jgi:DeoR/GlpR family transcriptional regulator of sugar metabolism
MGNASERKQQIQRLLIRGSSVQVDALAQQLGVSAMTIRRDLKELEHIGLLRKVHGGAVKEVSISYEPPFTLRIQKKKEEKRIIAQEALRFVSEGDTIAVDSGSTALAFAYQLANFHNLTIVTPSIHIAMLFLHHPSIRVFISGGELRKHEGSLIGDQTRAFFENLHFDAFFMASAGISVQSGMSEYILEDASIKRLIMSHSKKNIALMTSDKFGVTAFAQVCKLLDIDILVSDEEPSSDLKHELTTSGVEIYVARRSEGEKNELAERGL